MGNFNGERKTCTSENSLQKLSKKPNKHKCLKTKNGTNQLAGIYIKEQTEYIQNQIDKIRDSVKDRQYRIAWQTINEVSRRKSTAKAKLKAANQQERIKLWKQHFKNLLGNPPKITHEPITRLISKQLDIKHPTRHQLYGHLPPITKTIQVRRTKHAGHCWRSRDELIRDVLLWTPTHGRAKAGQPARTYIQQLCEDTGCCPEDLPRAMNDREEWRERVRDIHATSAT